jgi:hypothetical protein
MLHDSRLYTAEAGIQAKLHLSDFLIKFTYWATVTYLLFVLNPF